VEWGLPDDAALAANRPMRGQTRFVWSGQAPDHRSTRRSAVRIWQFRTSGSTIWTTSPLPILPRPRVALSETYAVGTRRDHLPSACQVVLRWQTAMVSAILPLILQARLHRRSRGDTSAAAVLSLARASRTLRSPTIAACIPTYSARFLTLCASLPRRMRRHAESPSWWSTTPPTSIPWSTCAGGQKSFP